MGSCTTKQNTVHSIGQVNRRRKKDDPLNPNNQSSTSIYNTPNGDTTEQSPRKGVLTESRKFDVNYKAIPNKIHRRGTILDDKIFGLVGLRNLGNTCFMNSALQCLMNIEPLSDYFLSGLHEEEINTDNFLGSKGKVIMAYAKLVKEYWEDENIEHLSPDNFYSEFGTFAPQFSHGTQEDSHEMLACLLDVIHEDLNRVKKRPIIEDKDDDKRPMDKQATEAWKNHLLRNRSIIVDLLQGQIKSSLKCFECGYVSHKFEPFMYMSVPIPEGKKKNLSLKDCIEEFLLEEKLEKDEKWHCPKCKDFKDSAKKIDIWTMPNILIVHLKRFKFTKHKRAKIRSLIDFPLTGLDLSDCCARTQKDKPVYDLFAISNHEGTLGSGHYTSYVKNRDDGLWYLMNDSLVHPMEDKEKLIDSSAYVLFYSKTSVDVFRRQTITNPEAWPHLPVLEGQNSSKIINRKASEDPDSSLVVVETPIHSRRRDEPKIFRPIRNRTNTSIVKSQQQQQQSQNNLRKQQTQQITTQNIQITNYQFNRKQSTIQVAEDEDHMTASYRESDPPSKKAKKMKQIVKIPKEQDTYMPSKGFQHNEMDDSYTKHNGLTNYYTNNSPSHDLMKQYTNGSNHHDYPVQNSMNRNPFRENTYDRLPSLPLQHNKTSSYQQRNPYSQPTQFSKQGTSFLPEIRNVYGGQISPRDVTDDYATIQQRTEYSYQQTYF